MHNIAIYSMWELAYLHIKETLARVRPQLYLWYACTRTRMKYMQGYRIVPLLWHTILKSIALWGILIVWLITGVITPNQPVALETVLSKAGGQSLCPINWEPVGQLSEHTISMPH